MSTENSPPNGFSPTRFDRPIPYADTFFPTYQRVHDQGVDIGAWVTEACCNAGRMAHGAFLMSLGDFATTLATFQKLGSQKRFTVHLNFNMNFYAAAPQGSWLEVRARVNRHGRSIVYTSCDYFANNELIGHADAILKSSERRKP